MKKAVLVLAVIISHFIFSQPVLAKTTDLGATIDEICERWPDYPGCSPKPEK